MSKLTVERAKELHERHEGISIPVDIERLAIAEGCELVDWPFIEPVKEVKQGRFIGIAFGLEQRERRHLIAHALAHHLLHCGNQLAFSQHWKSEPARQEKEAEECAAHILMPGRELEKVITSSIWELADYFGVPAELAYQRVSIYATQEELERWDNIFYESNSG